MVVGIFSCYTSTGVCVCVYVCVCVCAIVWLCEWVRLYVYAVMVVASGFSVWHVKCMRCFCIEWVSVWRHFECRVHIAVFKFLMNFSWFDKLIIPRIESFLVQNTHFNLDLAEMRERAMGCRPFYEKQGDFDETKTMRLSVCAPNRRICVRHTHAYTRTNTRIQH